MNPIRSLFDHLTRPRQAKRDLRLRISNLTRQSELATCAEVADDGAKRRKGLLGRQGLAPGEGLWILPCEAIHTFGMQFPIDLVYLDRKMCVRKVKGQVRPWRLSACLSAHSVLELAPGTISATQTRPGDMIEVSSTTQPADHSGALSSSSLATEIS
jgi:uncharacterized membrane protein (UPF0127 family)